MREMELRSLDPYNKGTRHFVNVLQDDRDAISGITCELKRKVRHVVSTQRPLLFQPLNLSVYYMNVWGNRGRRILLSAVFLPKYVQ